MQLSLHQKESQYILISLVNKASIIIKDEGIGIIKEKEKLIFERFGPARQFVIKAGSCNRIFRYIFKIIYSFNNFLLSLIKKK